MIVVSTMTIQGQKGHATTGRRVRSQKDMVRLIREKGQGGAVRALKAQDRRELLHSPRELRVPSVALALRMVPRSQHHQVLTGANKV